MLGPGHAGVFSRSLLGATTLERDVDGVPVGDITIAVDQNALVVAPVIRIAPGVGRRNGMVVREPGQVEPALVIDAQYGHEEHRFLLNERGPDGHHEHVASGEGREQGLGGSCH